MRKLSFARQGLGAAVACAESKGPDDTSESDEGGSDKTDWDASWKSFNEPASGRRSQFNVFQLPEENDGLESKPGDERIDRLTNVWSNDKAFLAGIGVIVLIAAFYIYIFLSGGIGSEVDLSAR